MFLFISVTLRWHSSVKNHDIWTFKVKFPCQKTSEPFQKKKIFIEKYQFKATLFVEYIFWWFQFSNHFIMYYNHFKFLATLSYLSITDIKKTFCFDFFVKMRFVSIVVHINVTTMIYYLRKTMWFTVDVNQSSYKWFFHENNYWKTSTKCL